MYGFDDISARASLRVSGNRTIQPRATLVHSSAGKDSRAWLLGDSALSGRPASADYLIAKDGKRYKLCRDDRYPYHAGISVLELDGQTYTGDEVSQLCIGVELEQLDIERPTFPQVDSLAELLVQLAGQYGWRWPFRVYGHYSVARPFGRRSDPVNFDWGGFFGRVYTHSLAAQLPGLVD